MSNDDQLMLRRTSQQLEEGLREQEETERVWQQEETQEYEVNGAAGNVQQEQPPLGFMQRPRLSDVGLDSKKKRKAFRSKEKKRGGMSADQIGSGLMSSADLLKARALRESTWGQRNFMRESVSGHGTMGELYDKVKAGDYSGFEKLDHSLRNELATVYMRETFLERYEGMSVEEIVNELTTQGDVSGLLNPVMRLGISLAMRSGLGDRDGDFFRELDTKLCTAVMVETLCKRPTHLENNVLRLHTQEERDTNLASQIFIAKNLMMAQMSDFRKISEQDKAAGNNGVGWDTDVAVAFAHCSRVMYVLPSVQQDIQGNRQADHDDMWDTMRTLRERHLGPNGYADGLNGHNGGMFARGGSTHDLKRRAVDGSQNYEEKKRFFLHPNLTGQFGMNVAIGGLGNVGIQGVQQRRMKNDGTCGHIYTMSKKADAQHNGSFLIGFESDEHKKTNQLGHTHTMMATGEHASSFGGQRTDEIGAKYGGRIADLSGFDAGAITAAMVLVEDYMRRANISGADIRPLIRRLAGPKMDPAQFNQFMTDMRQAYAAL